MRRALVSVLVLTLALAPTSAWAYSDWGWDPKDPGDQGTGDSLDLAMTRRDVVRGGGSTFRITFFVHTAGLSCCYRATVKLDSRGDRHADYLIGIVDADQSGHGCGVKRVGSRDGWGGRYARGDNWARCRFPLRRVNPDKRIRWKMRIYQEGLRAVTDSAPETGWYR